MNNFCVYEHWRPDLDVCFYVGKGKPRRAKTFEYRNDHYKKIIEKLDRLGLKPEVKIIESGLTNDEAIAAEIALICSRRNEGLNLANYTDGGDGTVGWRHSDEARRKIAEKARGRVASSETISKMISSRTGFKRSAETRAKQSTSAKRAQKVRFDALKQTDEGRELIRSNMIMMAHAGRGSEEYRENKRKAALVRWSRAKSVTTHCT